MCTTPYSTSCDCVSPLSDTLAPFSASVAVGDTVHTVATSDSVVPAATVVNASMNTAGVWHTSVPPLESASAPRKRAVLPLSSEPPVHVNAPHATSPPAPASEPPLSVVTPTYSTTSTSMVTTPLVIVKTVMFAPAPLTVVAAPACTNS